MLDKQQDETVGLGYKFPRNGMNNEKMKIDTTVHVSKTNHAHNPPSATLKAAIQPNH